jgi:arylsulfatase
VHNRDNSDSSVSRRDFLRLAGAGATTLGLAAIDATTNMASASAATASPAAHSAGNHKGPYNILFILTDQERLFRPGELPIGFSLPAHERLMKRGTTFLNHRINSCVCTSSRSVLYTGQHIQHTRMFDNSNFPWIESMSTEIPTVGDILREAGYYTAYKGKWHLTKEFETVNKEGQLTKIFTEEMEAYGFSDYVGVGDIIAHHQGGYRYDGITAAMTSSWLRGRGRSSRKHSSGSSRQAASTSRSPGAASSPADCTR